jgi:hypothetical protein
MSQAAVEVVRLLSTPAVSDFAPPSAHTVRRRSAAFASAVGQPDWPPRLADPFPGFKGVPEIAGMDLTAGKLGGAILHHGCLLVRGLVDVRGVERLTDALVRAFQAAAAFRAGAPVAGEEPWFTPFSLASDGDLTASGRSFVIDGGGVWTADSPLSLEALIDELRRAGVVEAVEGYLGERAYLSVGKSTLRRVPASTGTGWHQDGAFLGSDIRTVNCWLSLSDCGVDAPGLDLFPRRASGLYETGTKGSYFTWGVGDGFVAELEQEAKVVSPVFAPGDALLFDQLFLHRTGVRPGMTRDRLAIESWLFAGSTFPMKQIPLAL